MDGSQDFCLEFDKDSEHVAEEISLIEYTDDPIEIDYSNYAITSYY